MAEELFIQLQGNHQEIIFPAALVDPIGEVSVKQHDSNILNVQILYSISSAGSFDMKSLNSSIKSRLFAADILRLPLKYFLISRACARSGNKTAEWRILTPS